MISSKQRIARFDDGTTMGRFSSANEVFVHVFLVVVYYRSIPRLVTSNNEELYPRPTTHRPQGATMMRNALPPRQRNAFQPRQRIPALGRNNQSPTTLGTHTLQNNVVDDVVVMRDVVSTLNAIGNQGRMRVVGTFHEPRAEDGEHFRQTSRNMQTPMARAH